MASHIFWTLCANLVDGRVAFIQRMRGFYEKTFYTMAKDFCSSFQWVDKMNKIAKHDSKLTAPGKEEKEKILSDISFKYAYEILKRLADEDANISKRINELALEYLVEVDPDDVAESVFDDLGSLEVEDVWDNSGGTRHGYVDPNELASEMFEEAIEPYVEEMRKCLALLRYDEAKLHCQGILKGLYKFENEGLTEFKDWATDDPNTYFIQIFNEWKKGNKNPEHLEEMQIYVKNNVHKWYTDIMRK
ncbi:MAG TPA: hypothetical protein VN368_01105 [Candidatus Methylomirabilis sp.]|nr:hypothetical protein [Candidatus Methylomirabilis sp.]